MEKEKLRNYNNSVVNNFLTDFNGKNTLVGNLC